jgi:hypothetical protein
MFKIKKGNFAIVYRTTTGIEKRSNLSLEIVKYLPTDTCLSVCSVTKDGDIVSIWDRVLMELETQDDLDDIKYLVKILQMIMKTDEIFLDTDNNNRGGN